METNLLRLSDFAVISRKVFNWVWKMTSYDQSIKKAAFFEKHPVKKTINVISTEIIRCCPYVVTVAGSATVALRVVPIFARIFVKLNHSLFKGSNI
jgi:hypothetical protein